MGRGQRNVTFASRGVVKTRARKFLACTRSEASPEGRPLLPWRHPPNSDPWTAPAPLSPLSPLSPRRPTPSQAPPQSLHHERQEPERECRQHSPTATNSFDYALASYYEVCAAQTIEVCVSHLGILCSLHMMAGLRLERNHRFGWRSVDEEDVASPPPGDDGPGTRQDQCGGARAWRSRRALTYGASNAGWRSILFKQACTNMHWHMHMQT
jgi:hypothetical protein